MTGLMNYLYMINHTLHLISEDTIVIVGALLGTFIICTFTVVVAVPPFPSLTIAVELTANYKSRFQAESSLCSA